MQHLENFLPFQTLLVSIVKKDYSKADMELVKIFTQNPKEQKLRQMPYPDKIANIWVITLGVFTLYNFTRFMLAR